MNEFNSKKDNNQFEVIIKEWENNNKKKEIKKNAIEKNIEMKLNNLKINSNEGLSNAQNKNFPILQNNNSLKENNKHSLKEERIKEIININKRDEIKEFDIGKNKENNKNIKHKFEIWEDNKNIKELKKEMKQDKLILNKKNENEIKENPKIIYDNPKNYIL